MIASGGDGDEDGVAGESESRLRPVWVEVEGHLDAPPLRRPIRPPPLPRSPCRPKHPSPSTCCALLKRRCGQHRRFQRHGGVLKGGVLAVIATAIAVTEELGQVSQNRPDNRDLLARLPLPCPPL